MICQFSFKNFKSFKEEAVLDFFPAPINENGKSLIIDVHDGETFLPIIALYGPNGGGKSTVIHALKFVKTFILSKIITFKPKEDQEQINALQSIDLQNNYFIFDSKYKEIPSTFEILFRVNEFEYKYELSILTDQIKEENLYRRQLDLADGEMVFTRLNGKIELGETLHDVFVTKIKDNMPLLSFIYTLYDLDAIDRVVEWLSSIVFLNEDNPLQENRIYFPKDKKKQEIFFMILREMGNNISDIRIVENPEGEVEEVFTIHELPDGSKHEISFAEESSGTRKLFGCLLEIIESLEAGILIVADELDTKLHPKLLQYIIELFTNPVKNKYGAQLLLTSHDMTTMVPAVFRRDEICFCALNSMNASTLYALIDFRKENGKPPRNDESYAKQYIEGRYGAEPHLRRILNWEDTIFRQP